MEITLRLPFLLHVLKLFKSVNLVFLELEGDQPREVTEAEPAAKPVMHEGQLDLLGQVR